MTVALVSRRRTFAFVSWCQGSALASWEAAVLERFSVFGQAQRSRSGRLYVSTLMDAQKLGFKSDFRPVVDVCLVTRLGG